MKNSLGLIQISKNQLNDSKLKLSPIKVDENYRDKWNIYFDDFFVLTKGDSLVRNTLYCTGPFFSNLNDEYFLLIKHTEDYYQDSITTDSKRKLHLKKQWCIIDKHGNEKVEFSEFKSPYLIKDSAIYSVDGNFFNIESGYLYCKTSSYIESKQYLFLKNVNDESRDKGVYQIDKTYGTFILHP